jgi:ribosome biogenesis GTPase A
VVQPIHWFPGHMAKARREMSEVLKRVDAVLELVDARLPKASINPMLRELVGNKPRTIVMTRVDMADPSQTERWEQHFRAMGSEVVRVDARSGEGIKQILPSLEKVAVEKRQRDAKKGIRPRPLRTMVVGIPNVGKSSLINRLANRSATKIGDRPGITKNQQWIRLGNIELLDTPGVLWPKLEDEDEAYWLAITGAIKSDVLDAQSLAAYAICWFTGHYQGAFQSRYELSLPSELVWTDVSDVWPEVEAVLESIARKRGMVRSGGVPDLERAAELLLREVQTGKLGRMTFEIPPLEDE